MPRARKKRRVGVSTRRPVEVSMDLLFRKYKFEDVSQAIASWVLGLRPASTDDYVCCVVCGFRIPITPGCAYSLGWHFVFIGARQVDDPVLALCTGAYCDDVHNVNCKRVYDYVRDQVKQCMGLRWILSASSRRHHRRRRRGCFDGGVAVRGQPSACYCEASLLLPVSLYVRLESYGISGRDRHGCRVLRILHRFAGCEKVLMFHLPLYQPLPAPYLVDGRRKDCILRRYYRPICCGRSVKGVRRREGGA